LTLSPRPLEPDPEQLRAMLGTVVDYVVRAVEALRDGPAYDGTGVTELLADPELSRPPGEEGRPLADLLGVVDRAAAKGHINPSGGHMAYIPGSGIVSAAAADLVADVINRYTGIPDAGPGLVALESHLIRWLVDLFGLPATGGGILTTGGSMAALSALVAARHTRLGEEFADGTIYLTDQAHGSIAKAARIAGFPVRALRIVPVDHDARMDPGELARLIGEDRAAGRRPACVVGTAGTTNLGVVDPLAALADVAEAHGLWLHVDAAYGGFFQLTERGHARLAGIERADSIVLDAHKGLFLPFGTGCLLVRSEEELRTSHAGAAAHYLQDMTFRDLPSFADLSPELTRPSRGIRMWLPLHLHGVAAFRDTLDEKLDLAQRVHAALAADGHLTVLSRPELSIVAFRVRLRGGDPAAEDRATRAVLAGVNAEGRVFLSSTRVDDRDVGRVCILNHRTDAARVDEAVEAVRRHASLAIRPGNGAG
jgi:aromatic-L-amino-acid decarboxylase